MSRLSSIPRGMVGQAFTYPTRNFAQFCYLLTRVSYSGGPVISAGLPLSPEGSDYIFTACAVSGV